LGANLVSAFPFPERHKHINSYVNVGEEGLDVSVYYKVCDSSRHEDLISSTDIKDPIDGAESGPGKIMISTRSGRPFSRGRKCPQIGHAYDTVEIYFSNLYPPFYFEPKNL